MTAIYSYNGPGKPRECSIDDKTALWMVRMCVGEGGFKCSRDKASMMLWALMRRWMLWDKKRRYSSYLSLMRAFSQPINPRWQMGGDLAYKFRKKDAGSPARLARRRRICRINWTDLEEFKNPLVSAVRNFRDGKLFPPDDLVDCAHPRITNWASLPSTPKKYPWGMDVDGDWFFEDQRILKGIVEVG